MQNVAPDKWGASAWKFIHTIGEAYPKVPDRQTRAAMHHFLQSLHVILPCMQCRNHFREFCDASRLDSPECGHLLSNKALNAWLHRAHTEANKHRDARRAQKENGEPQHRAAGGSVVVADPAGGRVLAAFGESRLIVPAVCGVGVVLAALLVALLVTQAKSTNQATYKGGIGMER
jgi:hypothetical protein